MSCSIYSNIIGYTIILFFSVIRFWKFYLLYEFNIIPIILLILGYGNNPSRLPSTFYIIMYILIFSLPVLIIIIWNWKLRGCILINMTNYYINFIFIKIILLMFLVKTPVFFLHYWLLKAHVEASTIGSIILAGGLLKIGRYGLYKLVIWFKYNYLDYTIILVGSRLASIICIIQTDIKKLVAMMSVSHISISVASLLCLITTSLNSFFYINIRHSVSSSILFYVRGLIIFFRGRRSLFNFPFILFKFITLLYILTILVNIGVPPFFTFIREVYNISILLFKNYYSLIIIFRLVMAVSTYSIILLRSFKKSKLKMYKIHNYNNLLYLLLYLVLISTRL